MAKPLTAWQVRMLRTVGRAKSYRREDAMCRRHGFSEYDQNPVSDALFRLVERGFLDWFDKGDEDAPLFYRLTAKGRKWRSADNRRTHA